MVQPPPDREIFGTDERVVTAIRSTSPRAPSTDGERSATSHAWMYHRGRRHHEYLGENGEVIEYVMGKPSARCTWLVKGAWRGPAAQILRAT